MKTQQHLERVPLLQGVVPLILGLSMSFSAGAQGRLTIKGHVTVPVGTEAITQATLLDGQGATMAVALARNGAFQVNMPADDRYILRFETAGCVTKEVAVDARNAVREEGQERTVRFDIVLHENGPDGVERYTGAVGTIGFDRSSGEMLVQHRYELQRVSQLIAYDQ